MARTNKKGGNTAGLKGWSGFQVNRSMDNTSKSDGRAGSSAFQKDSWWKKAVGKVTQKAKDFKQEISDKSVNLGSVFGGSAEERAIRKADFKQQADRKRKQEAMHKQASEDRDTHSKAYFQWKKDNPKAGNEAHKRATAYADAQVKAKHDEKKRKLASKSPKTKEQSEKKRKDFVTKS